MAERETDATKINDDHEKYIFVFFVFNVGCAVSPPREQKYDYMRHRLIDG